MEEAIDSIVHDIESEEFDITELERDLFSQSPDKLLGEDSLHTTDDIFPDLPDHVESASINEDSVSSHGSQVVPKQEDSEVVQPYNSTDNLSFHQFEILRNMSSAILPQQLPCDPYFSKSLPPHPGYIPPQNYSLAALIQEHQDKMQQSFMQQIVPPSAMAMSLGQQQRASSRSANIYRGRGKKCGNRIQKGQQSRTTEQKVGDQIVPTSKSTTSTQNKGGGRYYKRKILNSSNAGQASSESVVNEQSKLRNASQPSRGRGGRGRYPRSPSDRTTVCLQEASRLIASARDSSSSSSDSSDSDMEPWKGSGFTEPPKNSVLVWYAAARGELPSFAEAFTEQIGRMRCKEEDLREVLVQHQEKMASRSRPSANQQSRAPVSKDAATSGVKLESSRRSEHVSVESLINKDYDSVSDPCHNARHLGTANPEFEFLNKLNRSEDILSLFDKETLQKHTLTELQSPIIHTDSRNNSIHNFNS